MMDEMRPFDTLVANYPSGYVRQLPARPASTSESADYIVVGAELPNS